MAKQKSSLAAAFKGSLGRLEVTQNEQAVASNGSHETVNNGNLDAVVATAEVEMVPGANGKQLPADQNVNMTFTVTAKERYLWNLELSRRGLTGVSVLRRAMSELRNQEDL